MALFNDSVKTQIKGILDQAVSPVTMELFTQEMECRSCADLRAFAEEIAGLSGNARLVSRDFLKDAERAKSLKVERIPALVLGDEKGAISGVTFYGVPGGYEINSFLGAFLEISGKREPLPAELAARVAAINRDVHIQVVVMLSCPHCPDAVAAAHRLAMESPRVRSDMIDAQLYPTLVQKYDVTGVPLTIINESVRLTGPHKIDTLVSKIEGL